VLTGLELEPGGSRAGGLAVDENGRSGRVGLDRDRRPVRRQRNVERLALAAAGDVDLAELRQIALGAKLETMPARDDLRGQRRLTDRLAVDEHLGAGLGLGRELD